MLLQGEEEAGQEGWVPALGLLHGGLRLHASGNAGKQSLGESLGGLLCPTLATSLEV